VRASVASVFTEFQAKFEGVCPFLYLDVRGLVTCAIGLLVDPVELALPLPWTIGDYPATQLEIRNAWDIVKGHQEMAQRGGFAFESLTTIRLTQSAIKAVTLQKAAQMEEILRTYFPSYDGDPADAQLGLLSMAWALGPAFAPRWPFFSAAYRSGDYATCAEQCQLSAAGNPGVVPRNAATRALFEAAGAGSDPDVVDWP
jgi:GH24 family phage-related lysozyme (muramidase)